MNSLTHDNHRRDNHRRRGHLLAATRPQLTGSMPKSVGPRFPSWASLGVLLACLTFTACGEEPRFSTAGKLEFSGRPVYPATLLFRGTDGNVLPTSTAADGTFRLFDVKKDKYRVAVQTPKLANLGGNQAVQGDQSPEAVGTREATVPEKFKNAFTAIPAKYEDFSTSDLEVDFSDAVPAELPIVLNP